MRAPAFASLAILVLGCGGDDPAATPDAGGGDAPPGECGSEAPWASAPPLMRGPTQETAVVAVGDKVYILGGFDDGGAVLSTVQIFDATTCSYARGPELPKPVHHANAAVVDGTIFVTGALQAITFTPIGDTWAWDPAGEAGWTERAAMPAGSQRGAAITGAIDGKIYVAGGLRDGAVTDVSVYDPALDSWSAEAPLPEARDHACGGVIADKLYVAGGRQATIGSTTGTVFELTPGAGWAPRAMMPTPRGGTACAVVGDRLVVVGGEGNPDAATGVFEDVEAYAPAADRWDVLAPMPTPRHGMGAAAVGERMYVPGGADRQAFAAVATHEILTP